MLPSRPLGKVIAFNRSRVPSASLRCSAASSSKAFAMPCFTARRTNSLSVTPNRVTNL